MSALIIFGAKPPKNWRENLQKQKDPEFQRLIKPWISEKDPVKRKEYADRAEAYWAAKMAAQSSTKEE